MSRNLKSLLQTILFFLRTRHTPGAYRLLFREISSCYLTDTAPGVATVAGFATSCTTNRQLMTISLNGKCFWILREKLLVREDDTDWYGLEDARSRWLRRVLNEMIRRGVPYQMSWTGGYQQSDVHLVKMEMES